MKRILAIIFIVVLLFVCTVFYYNYHTDPLYDLREEVDFYNYNVKIDELQYKSNIGVVKNNSIEIIEYMKNKDIELVFLTDSQMSNLDYFIQIIEAHLTSSESIEDIFGSEYLNNYQFLDLKNNKIIDYYYLNTSNASVSFEIIYSGSNVSEVKII